MRRIVNPQQTRLFDSFNPVLTDQTQRLLLGDWPGVFRHVILDLMPAEQLGSHLQATMGRPSKELYSMAGLLLLMELMDWTKQEAMYEYCFNMASFGRTRLMGVAIKRFLTQLKRHDPKAYELLDEPLRRRYAPGVNQLFGAIGKDNESRRLLRQQVAEDMYLLIHRFAGTSEHSGRDTYKSMKRKFALRRRPEET